MKLFIQAAKLKRPLDETPPHSATSQQQHFISPNQFNQIGSHFKLSTTANSESQNHLIKAKKKMPASSNGISNCCSASTTSSSTTGSINGLENSSTTLQNYSNNNSNLNTGSLSSSSDYTQNSNWILNTQTNSNPYAGVALMTQLQNGLQQQNLPQSQFYAQNNLQNSFQNMPMNSLQSNLAINSFLQNSPGLNGSLVNPIQANINNNGFFLNGVMHYLQPQQQNLSLQLQQQQIPIEFDPLNSICRSATNVNSCSFEGMPIFLVPNASNLTFNGLQRATVTNSIKKI